MKTFWKVILWLSVMGLIFLMLCNSNLQDQAVFAMWSLKVSWSSKITPRFLTELDGVIVDEPNWMVKSCCIFQQSCCVSGIFDAEFVNESLF